MANIKEVQVGPKVLVVQIKHCRHRHVCFLLQAPYGNQIAN